MEARVAELGTKGGTYLLPTWGKVWWGV